MFFFGQIVVNCTNIFEKCWRSAVISVYPLYIFNELVHCISHDHERRVRSKRNNDVGLLKKPGGSHNAENIKLALETFDLT